MARCIVLKTRCAHISGKAERERIMWRFFCRKFGYLLAYSYLCKPLQMKGYEPKTS
jgi:hypothetical protein